MNGRPQPGLDLARDSAGSLEQFNTLAIGWIHDGQRMHDEVVYQPILATLDRERGYLGGWVGDSHGGRWGAEMKVAGQRPFELAVHFAGRKGLARFDVWGDPASRITSPVQSLDYHTAAGGAHVIAWRRFFFAGEFTSPTGVENLEGVGYFQRVCMNFPAFPWKWIWATFEDNSQFSAFLPYAGLQALRQSDRYYPNFLERTTLDIKGSAEWSWGGTSQAIRFGRVRVTPTVGNGDCPSFEVRTRSTGGDWLSYRTEPYGQSKMKMTRRLLGGLWRSGFNYNEFLFRVRDLQGNVGGRDISQAGLGNGYGNIEYTWGLGL